MDGCVAGVCRHDALTGLDGVRCAFTGAGLQPPLCADDVVPRGITRGITKARNLIDKARAATKPAKAKRLAKQAATALRGAEHGLARLKPARLTATCAAALRSGIDNALQRTEQWLATAPSH